MDEHTGARTEAPANVLEGEHLLLGATMEPGATGRPEAAWYGDGTKEPVAFEEGCALADVGGLVATCISGDAASAFVSAVFTSYVPEPGSVLGALALMGDGRVVAPALVAGLAVNEFCVWCPGELSEGLMEWMRGIAAVEEGGVAPYASVELSCGAPLSSTLMVAGPDATAVLGDYLAPDAALPKPATLSNVRLDAIDTVVLRPAIGSFSPYLVVAPNAFAQVLWRSLLSFPNVSPVGTSAVWGRVADEAPGLVDFLDEPMARRTPKDLGLQGLLRPGDSYIGARALANGPAPKQPTEG
ncbi:hypothetical protein AAK967_02005 [Atopobiaceae bacterium 24-176]